MNRRVLLAAAAATLAVAAALGVHVASGTAGTPLDERRASQLTGEYRRDAVAHVPAGLRYTEAVRAYVACATPAGQYIVSSRFDLSTGTAADAATALTNLRVYWKQRGYRVVNDSPGINGQLLVENPADGFRIGISQRAALYLRLAVSSPCLTPDAPPVAPVLPQDLATAHGTYERYVAGQLGQLTTQVADLRAAVAAGDVNRARAAWLTAQLTWERVGAAYGSFGDLADAVDGVPGGADFTGLHRIEYGLWHGESGVGLLGVVDRLATDIGKLSDTLHDVVPEPGDLPVRTHEILEDALRDHLTGLTDFGSGAALAETWADIDGTRLLLDTFAPLIEARRPGLVDTARTGLDGLRQKLERCRTGAAWPSPGALDPATRAGIEAALGGVLETLAAVPGVLEVVGS